MIPAGKSSPAGRWLLRRLPRLLLLVCVLATLNFGGRWLIGVLEGHFMPWYQLYGAVALAAVVGLYIVLMALPFVPGIEVSLALLMILGADGVPVVYGATLAALCLSFLVGRLVPPRIIGRGLGWLQLDRAQALVARMAPLPAEARLRVLTEDAPVRLIPFLLRYRYLAVAVAFNLPGNGLIGGGGGIALVAGLSGLFRFPAYVGMVALAIAPIPVLVLVGARF